MNKFIKFSFLLLAFTLVECTVDPEVEPINWVDWTDWDNKRKLGDRPAIVWIHTASCENCIKQEKEFFGDPVIVNYINEHFYAAHLLDTYKEDIVTQNNTFRYVQRYSDVGYHDLAYHLTKAERLKNQLPPYPSIALLDKDFHLILPITKMIDVQELEMLLAYVKEEAFKTTKIKDFKAQYEGKL